MLRTLNRWLTWLCFWIGVASGTFWLFSAARDWVEPIVAIVIALATWLLLHRFGISDRRIQKDADRRRRELGYDP